MDTKICPRFLLALVGVLGIAFPQIGTAEDVRPMNQILARALEIELGHTRPHKYEQLLSSGPIYAVLQKTGELERRAASAQAFVQQSLPAKAMIRHGRQGSAGVPTGKSAGCPNRFTGSHGNGGPNIRVNQDCSFRRQAEEVIAINPTNSKNLIAGQNDSRLGFNHCGFDFSFDGGRTWGDLVPPFYMFLLGDGQTADACSDPTATFDAEGNAYIGGILFQINSPASAVVVSKSNAGIGGAFYHSPQPGPFQTFSSDVGVVANDNNPAIFNDKEFIVADQNPHSPKANNVYATWTRFAFTGVGVQANSPISFSQSTDGGATWSPGITISGSSGEVCGIFSGSVDPDACDQDQGSHPVVGPDGTVYVAFANLNTPILGVNQILIVSCPPTEDCSDPTSWTDPVKVADLVGTHPIGPDARTGCPAGRQCLPPNGYRVPEFTSISVAVDHHSHVYVTWSDFRNGGGSCDWNDGAVGQAALATPPCDNDVFYVFSEDGGATWSDPVQLSAPDSAQWQPWSDVTRDGSKLWVAYYDRSFGDCEFTGCQDITLVRILRPASHSPAISHFRLTTSSMPNLIPANNPFQAGFLGDYMWVDLDDKGRPHVVWADTRGRDGTVEEDIYFTRFRGGRGDDDDNDGDNGDDDYD